VDQVTIQKVREMRAAALMHLQRRDPRRASYFFTRAAYFAEDIEDPLLRRNEYGPLAEHLIRAGLGEMGLRLALEAISIDRKLGDTRRLVSDFLSYGNALGRMGRHGKALEAFKQALDISLTEGAYANAASAATNIAAIYANGGRFDDALKLLSDSLGYLRKSPFPETEVDTRLSVLRLYEHLKKPPRLSLDFGRETLDCVGTEMGQRRRAELSGLLNEAAGRRAAEEPSLSREELIAQLFPELVSEGE
jgi:tetratricopeptide (TPR) repeat protein